MNRKVYFFFFRLLVHGQHFWILNFFIFINLFFKVSQVSQLKKWLSNPFFEVPGLKGPIAHYAISTVICTYELKEQLQYSDFDDMKVLSWNFLMILAAYLVPGLNSFEYCNVAYQKTCIGTLNSNVKYLKKLLNIALLESETMFFFFFFPPPPNFTACLLPVQ